MKARDGIVIASVFNTGAHGPKDQNAVVCYFQTANAEGAISGISDPGIKFRNLYEVAGYICSKSYGCFVFHT